MRPDLPTVDSRSESTVAIRAIWRAIFLRQAPLGIRDGACHMLNAGDFRFKIPHLKNAGHQSRD